MPQNPIQKAHLEGVEKLKKQFVPSSNCQRHWSDDFSLSCTCDSDVANQQYQLDKFKSFLTTYAESILNAAKEAVEEKPGYEINFEEDNKAAGFNECRSSFHSAIDEGIKEITKSNEK